LHRPVVLLAREEPVLREPVLREPVDRKVDTPVVPVAEQAEVSAVLEAGLASEAGMARAA
jgi:hypothetical protein